MMLMKNIICCYSVLFFLNNTKLIDKFSLIGCTITKINQLTNENSQILKKKPQQSELAKFVNFILIKHQNRIKIANDKYLILFHYIWEWFILKIWKIYRNLSLGSPTKYCLASCEILVWIYEVSYPFSIKFPDSRYLKQHSYWERE